MNQQLRSELQARASSEVFFPAATLAAARTRRRRRVRRRGALLAAACLATLGGVTQVVNLGGGNAPEPSTHAPESEAIVLPIKLEQPLSDLPTGQVVGVMELEAGCLVVNDAVLVFASGGTTWNDESQSLISPEGDTYAVGSQVDFGGGYVPMTDAITAALGVSGAEAVRECMRRTGAHEIALADTTPYPG